MPDLRHGPPEATLPTSLGPPLRRVEGRWVLDVTELSLVHGLSVLTRALVEVLMQNTRPDRFEVVAERRLRVRETPELVEQHGIERARVTVDAALVDEVLAEPETFERRLRALLGSLQRRSLRDALLPADRAATKALLAEFGEGAARQRFVLEQVARRDGAGGAFLVSVDRPDASRLDLARLPSVTICDVDEREFLAGSTRIAQTWAEALHREAERGVRAFHEGRSPHSHLFRQLDRAGLSSLQRVSLRWSEAAQTYLLEEAPADVARLLKRVLLAFEDQNVRTLLARREVVRIDAGALPVYLDLTQLGRALELSLGRPPQRDDVGAFLSRMPALRELVEARRAAAPLAGARVFLVHHMTAEVVGTIGALRALGCRDLVALFVSYSGEPPAAYLDAVLDLPPDEFAALALVDVPDQRHVEGRYRLSGRYSRLPEEGLIQASLSGRDGDYLTAMRAAAVVPFLEQLQRAQAAGERMLLVEDGGYLGPVVQESALQGLTVEGFAQRLGHDRDDPRLLTDAFEGVLVATVEHTRNGFDRLERVANERGRLALPSYSIAISRLKREVESREVAASVLNALEAVLNAEGLVLARRSALVIGCVGAIGSELVRSLGARLNVPDAQLAGIDPRVVEVEPCCVGAASLGELGEERWLTTDLVIGVAGASALTGGDLELWLSESPHARLTICSGSTKKVEFAEVMAWMDQIITADAPQLAGRPVEVAVDELLDPRTGRLYGHRWRFTFADDGRSREVLALGQLTPLNFLFYGVATELIDDVLTQLVQVSLGALQNGAVAPALYAVDRDVDVDGSFQAPSESQGSGGGA